MVFKYVACSERGDIVKGRLSAANEEAAVDLLGYAGYKVINLKPYVPFFSTDRLLYQLYQVKPAEIILFYRQLALLLESGINIIASLELLQGQIANRLFKKILHDVVADLRSGHQFSVALSKHPSVFPEICCRSLSIGEQTGGLEVMLRQMADYMEKEVAAGKSIKSALMYPIIASVVTVIVVAVLVVFVLPAFSNLYGSLGAELPALTKGLIAFSEWARTNALVILLAILVVASVVYIYLRTPDGSYQWDKLMLKLPLMGRVNLLNELARSCRSISLLFRAGLPLTEVMPLIIQGSGNKVMVKAFTAVQQDMLKGEGLARPMSGNPVFLPMMVQMVKVGEETGNLDTALMAVAQSYETEAEDSMRSLIGLIQPVMTLVIAVVVGVIALSMVSAMYSIYGQAF
ncbi:MAG: type II secretion system F family protein [Chloroflexota bacterium]